MVYENGVSGGQFLAHLSAVGIFGVRGLDWNQHREGVKGFDSSTEVLFVKGCGHFTVGQRGGVLGRIGKVILFCAGAWIGFFAEQNRCYTPMNIYVMPMIRSKCTNKSPCIE